MKLSVGKEAFPIEFDNGDKDVIYFNPNDPDLALRLMTARDNIEKKLKVFIKDEKDEKEKCDTDVGDFSKDGENSENTEHTEHMENSKKKGRRSSQKAKKNGDEERIYETVKSMESVKKIICEEIDRAFNGDISSVVFKHCSPLAVVNGEYFIVQFLNAITPEIQKHIKMANSVLEEKVLGHIGKYQRR